MEKIICFSFGLTTEESEKGKASYCEANKDACDLQVIAVTKTMLKVPVGEVLDGLVENGEMDRYEKLPKADSAEPSAAFPYKAVVVDTRERSQVLQIMRGFKAVVGDPRAMIFAVITPTARTWTFTDYFEHLVQEHEQMTKG